MQTISKPQTLPETDIIAFEVIAEDVALGCKVKAHECVVARALQRAFPEAFLVSVCQVQIDLAYCWRGDNSLIAHVDSYKPSPELRARIYRFDATGEFEVGWYTMEKCEDAYHKNN